MPGGRIHRFAMMASVILITLYSGGQTQPSSATATGSVAPVSSTSVPRGQVIDSLACISDPTETYAVYIPSAYTPMKQWPIIYIFDPSAHGKFPVNLYKEAAEKYGYILAASNNSRNFQTDAVSRAASALWDDTHVRLVLDPHRIYMMGMSGGARVATGLAIRCEFCAVAGVISHGAGYPFPPSEKDRFAYFAFVGDRDFNWPEIMELRRKKEEWAAPYRLKVFSGGHDWAPAAIFGDALEWLQMKAMQAGSIPPDPTFIEQQFAKTQQEAEEAHLQNDPIVEFDAYRSLVFDFSGLKDVTQFQTKLAALKNSTELKQALKKQQDAMDEQQSLTQQLSLALSQFGDAPPDSQLSLRSAISDGMAGLKNKAAHAKMENERLIFIRSFDTLWVQGVEAGQAELESGKHLDKAELYFQLMSAVAPDEPWPVLLLAETAAVRGDKKRAYKDLHEAIKRGVKNPDTVDKDAYLQSLRGDPEFQQIVADLKARYKLQPTQ